MDSTALLLNGKTLRIATVEIPPFVELIRGDNNKIIAGTGFCFEILDALMKIYNFSISIEVPKDKAYGAQLANGLWSGMIAMILNNETDIGIGSFTLTHSRYQVIDYTVPYFEETNGILIPAAKLENTHNVFTKPFRSQVWLTLIAILLILPSLLWAHYWNFGKTKLSTDSKRKPKLIFVYGVLLSQSGLKLPGKENSLRFLAVLWCLSSVVFIHAYVGTLISYISVPRLQPIIRTLDEVPSSGLGWFVWRGSDLESTFLKATNGVNRVIGDGLRKYPDRVTESLNDAEQAVVNGSFVYMNSIGAVSFSAKKDFIASGGKCRVNVAKERFYEAHQAFVLPKNSSLRLIFDKKIQMMVEAGLVDYWRMKYFSLKDTCGPDIHTTVSHRLTFNDMKSSFFIWMTGAAIAFSAFLTENVAYLIKIKFGRPTWHRTV